MVRPLVRLGILAVTLSGVVGVVTPTLPAANPIGLIVDSKLSLAEATKGTTAPKRILDSLRIFDVHYLGFDRKPHLGQVVVNKELVSEVDDIFRKLLEHGFPIERVVPISIYGWSDERSMADNNTSAFNYRTVEGSQRLSKHALGRAIDINPALNPYRRGNAWKPSDSRHDPSQPGTITDTSVVVRIFVEKGWRWGGRWRSVKDYQHFEKD